MKKIAMIPARMGSQRLKKKNLLPVKGLPLITRAIRKCKEAGVFDEIWVNSENSEFGPIALSEGVHFHQRPEALGSNEATSEQFVKEFLDAHECGYLFQVHSIAPLLTALEVKDFVQAMQAGDYDAFMSVIDENLECLYKQAPVNFTFDEKTNSQDLLPVQRIVWAITGWRRSSFLDAANAEKCATYSGNVGCFSVGRMAGHVIKTQEDLDIAEAMFDIVHN